MNGITIVPVKIKGEDHHAFMDGHGYIYTLQELKELYAQVKSFYEIEDIDVMIERGNRMKTLEYRLENHAANYSQEMPQKIDGLFQLPNPIYKYKKFNPDKKKWSCKCNWCGTKVSSEDYEGYFTLNNFVFDISMERACSDDCAKLIWKDKLKEWIYDNDYQEFFSL